MRLLVSNGDDDVVHANFADLPHALRRGDVVVVNTSATIPAAIPGTLPPDGTTVRVHFSTEMPGGFWLVEARRPAGVSTVPLADDLTGTDLTLAGGGHLTLLDRLPGSQRLWLASAHLGAPVIDYLGSHGEPIRYRHAPGSWPLSAYQQIFGTEPGSAEMPSAAPPVHRRRSCWSSRGAASRSTTILLHAGVSSLEAHEMPYPERYRVPDATAAHLNGVHDAGGRVIAVGTTVVRALESVTDEQGTVHPGSGWTDLVVTPERGVRAVDGLVTGWHEPEASHLLMLEAIAGRAALERAYGEARRHGLPVARVRRQPPAASRIASDTMSDRRVAPPLPEGRRAVLYALRRRGQGTAEDIARNLDMTVSGARQHLERARRRRPGRSDRAPAAGGAAGPAPARVHGRPIAPTASSPRRTASSPTSCSGTSRSPTAELVDQLFARRRDERVRNASARLATRRSLKDKVVELTRILDEDGYLATCEPMPGRPPRSSSTTAPSSRWPASTGRRARARSTSSAPSSRARPWNGSATFSTAPTTAPTRYGPSAPELDRGRRRRVADDRRTAPGSVRRRIGSVGLAPPARQDTTSRTHALGIPEVTMAASSAGLHEPAEKLQPETIDQHRALVSIMEELEAVDWYHQRADATDDPELAAVLSTTATRRRSTRR